jgi:hypothetical protein
MARPETAVTLPVFGAAVNAVGYTALAPPST